MWIVLEKDVAVKLLHNSLVYLFISCLGKGKGRGRTRIEENNELTNSRPSAPSTLFDFLESKMGSFSIEGEFFRNIKYGFKQGEKKQTLTSAI